LQANSGTELGGIPSANSISRLYPIYLRGEAYLAGWARRGRRPGISENSRPHWHRLELLDWGALARLGIARANALQWKMANSADVNVSRVRALAAYKDFLVLWKDADPEIPILKQVRFEYPKLQKRAV
jgi:hypothetical protein